MKKGYIKMTDCLYKRDWKDLYILFKDFRPTHIEFRHWENDVWYFYGESEFFEEVEEGDKIPQYDVLFTRQDDGAYTYQFIKC